MTRWAPWLVAFIVWNGTFDWQVRRAGDAFTASQLERWDRKEPPLLIRDAFRPRVAEAAVRATGVAGLVLVAGLGWRRRAARMAVR